MCIIFLLDYQPNHIYFLYNLYNADSGIVDLNQIVGLSVGLAISVLVGVLGGILGGIVWGVILSVLVFVVGETVSFVISDYVMAVWYDYEVKGREGGVLSSDSLYGTTYSIRDADGNEVGVEHEGVTPGNWTSDNSALSIFTCFHSPAIYNGWSYFIWA